jgi:ketosteroid isomerase-like protein
MTMRSLAAMILVAGGALGEERAMPARRVVEIRSYNLKPGSRAEFHRLASEVVPMLKRWDIDVVGHGPSAHDEDSYFLIRSFASLEERNRREDAFYGSEEWRSGPREPILSRIASYTTVVVEMDASLVEQMRTAPPSAASPTTGEEARRAVAALDLEYQAAVKRNDADTMARILHDGFVLVLGNGTVYTREDLLRGARAGEIQYEKQDEDEGTQTVRVWGDTAVVTARLWLKGRRRGEPFDRRLWFSDTYVRTPAGWRYAFGQASLRLPPEAAAGRK